MDCAYLVLGVRRWASVDGDVYFRFGNQAHFEVSERVKLLEAKSEPLHEVEMMNVKSAYVVISAPSYRATIVPDSDYVYTLHANGMVIDRFSTDYDLTAPGPYHVEPMSEVIYIVLKDLLLTDFASIKSLPALILRELSSGECERIRVAHCEEDMREFIDAAELGHFKIV